MLTISDPDIQEVSYHEPNYPLGSLPLQNKWTWRFKVVKRVNKTDLSKTKTRAAITVAVAKTQIALFTVV